MKVKVGDTVMIIAGKDKGKSGKVIRTLKNDCKVVVEGLNIMKKHSKPSSMGDKGGIFDIEAPIHVSNVKVVTEAEVKKEEKAKVKASKTKEKEEKVEEKPKAKKTTAKKASSKKASK